MANIQSYLQEQAKLAQQEIAELAGQEGAEIVEVSWPMLQAAATDFIKATYDMELLDKLRQGKIKDLLVANKTPEHATKAVVAEIIKTKDAARTFYTNLFKFDTILTRYLNEVPRRGVIVVTDTQGYPSAHEMSLEKMASIVQAEGRLKNYSGKNSVESQVEKNFKADLQHIEQGQAAFMGVNARLNEFYSRRLKKKDGSEFQRQGGLLMWKSNGEWEIAIVNNKGALAEAYTNFLFTRHHTKSDLLCNVERGQAPYYNHDFIELFYKRYMNQATSLAAVVEEDVVRKYAQYAVKAEGSELSSPSAHIQVASEIISSKSSISPRKLKERIKGAFIKNDPLAPLIKGKMIDSLTGAIKSIDKLDKVKKNMQSKGWISVDADDSWLDEIQKVIDGELRG